VNCNTHKNGLNHFSLFFENVNDFKLNYYVQHRNSKITKYLSKDTILYRIYGQFSRVFCGTDDQKCFPWVLLEFVVWGSEKLFLGVLKKNNLFFENYSQWRTY